MTARDDASLLDMAASIHLILEFTQNMNQAEFEIDRKTQSAVLYQIAILGEAVKRLSQNFRNEHPQIPWASIAGMRDKLVHDYDGIDIKRVWLTLAQLSEGSETSTPEFLTAIDPLLPPREDLE